MQEAGIEDSAESTEGGVNDKGGDHGRNGGFAAVGQKATGGQAGRLRHAEQGLEADSGIGYPSGSALTPQIRPERELQNRHQASTQNSSGKAEDGEVWRMIVAGVAEGVCHRRTSVRGGTAAIISVVKLLPLEGANAVSQNGFLFRVIW